MTTTRDWWTEQTHRARIAAIKGDLRVNATLRQQISYEPDALAIQRMAELLAERDALLEQLAEQMR